MGRDPEVALLTPGAEIIQCTVCNEIIWSHVTDPITTRISLPSRSGSETTGKALQMMMEAANDLYLQTVLIPSEEACREHMLKRHRIRLWLWDQFGWDRVLRRWFR